jgi:hypothetical protein
MKNDPRTPLKRKANNAASALLGNGHIISYSNENTMGLI